MVKLANDILVTDKLVGSMDDIYMVGHKNLGAAGKNCLSATVASLVTHKLPPIFGAKLEIR